MLLLSATAVLSVVPSITHGQRAGDPPGTIEVASPQRNGDGTIGAPAAAAMQRGALRLPADTILKAKANRARAVAEKSGTAGGPQSLSERAVTGSAARTMIAPMIVEHLNINGLSDPRETPPDTTGAIGTRRFIQLVNRKFGIYNRGGALLDAGTLNELAGVGANVKSFNPQVIWDPETARFYYTMNAVFSANDNKLAFGFSRTARPDNGTTDWCHYTYTPANPRRFPDYPKLGDSQHFIIIGVNSFRGDGEGAFLGSDLVAISKPPSSGACPAINTFKVGTALDLRDTSNERVFTPVPANQIDDSSTGYVVARHGTLPSTLLWFFNVTRERRTGNPVFGDARSVTIPAYDVPPDATQPPFDPPLDYSPLLDTLDARLTQAVQAVNPGRADGNTFRRSMWTQHTVGSGGASAVHWYEIDPVPATPLVLRAEAIGAASTAFLFNAAISPDRRVYQRRGGEVLREFGDSFVIHYNASGPTIPARIVAGSSHKGGGLTFFNVRNGSGPYRDSSCPNDASPVCRWGDYAAAAPDPSPPEQRPLLDRGVVWGTNQYSGVLNPPVTRNRWRTRIFQLAP